MVTTLYLVCMTTLQHPTVPTTDPPAPEPLGARLAAASRRAQGLATVVNDPAVLAELRELCGLPRPVPRAEPGYENAPALELVTTGGEGEADTCPWGEFRRAK